MVDGSSKNVAFWLDSSKHGCDHRKGSFLGPALISGWRIHGNSRKSALRAGQILINWMHKMDGHSRADSCTAFVTLPLLVYSVQS